MELPREEAIMRIMTFNLRFETDSDGPNAWSFRRRLVIEVIRHHSPSILGTQEGTCSQIDYLRDHLSDYSLHTPGRIFDETCQYPTLFVRKNEFQITGGAEFWLSETPDVHRSSSWDSAFPRMLSYATARWTKTHHSFVAAVTHLDHMGTTARFEQAKLVAAWKKYYTEPLIIMGDFNDSPGSPAHRLLVHPETGLRDTWECLGRDEGRESFTYHGFEGIPQKARMDWILVTSHFRVTDAHILWNRVDGRYPSDHFPYMADLELV